ncbi:MAG: LOG family protein, partial [Pseudomonadota bacterium]
QTGKSTRMPIILVHEPFWAGLLDWFKHTLVKEGVIDQSDLDLFTVVNSADEVLDTIFRFYETSGFEASEAEQEIKLNL